MCLRVGRGERQYGILLPALGKDRAMQVPPPHPPTHPTRERFRASVRRGASCGVRGAGAAERSARVASRRAYACLTARPERESERERERETGGWGNGGTGPARPLLRRARRLG